MVKLLFYSSCGMVLANAYSLIVCTNPIKIIWICGLITSLLNHSITDEYPFQKQLYRSIDRYTMRYGFVIYTLYQVEYLYILYFACCLYFLSKILKDVRFHMLAHFFCAIFHNKMLQALK